MAPDFSVKCYNEQTIDFANLHGKVVLITFWSSWCPPCLKEMSPSELPQQVLSKFSAEKDFFFLPISVSESREKLTHFFDSEKGKPYLYLKDITGIDADREIFGLFAKQSVPRTVLVGRDGKILYTSSGYNMDGDDLSPLADQIKQALLAPVHTKAK